MTRLNEEREAVIRALMQVPGLARASAEVLIDNGYTSVEELAYVPQFELVGESGLTAADALALRSSARELLLRSTSGEG